jgi:5-methylcytosine-specific restriction endonuclease McrA
MKARLIRKYGPHCQICVRQGKQDTKINMDALWQDDSFSFDHIVALADGGLNEEVNIWPTHIACNERKGSIRDGGRVRSNRKPRVAVSR